MAARARPSGPCPMRMGRAEASAERSSRPPRETPNPCGITTKSVPPNTNCSSAPRKRAYRVGFPKSEGAASLGAEAAGLTSAFLSV